VLTRGVGEIANLLSLFQSPEEELGRPIRVTSESYAELSGRNVHVSPKTSPQTYEPVGRPKGGGYYQDAGLMICQNELAKALTF
jgi:hypothetical protein